jgi:hypothetical protein
MILNYVSPCRMPAEITETLAPPCTSWPATEWQRREHAHRARVAEHAEAFVRRRAAGQKHPVWDFLFTYYSFSPGKLMTWCPALEEEQQRSPDGLLSTADMITWEWPDLTDRIRREAAWIAQLCGNIVSRPARFACHGLHEWAMVYKQSAEQVRHNGYELRMDPGDLAAFVESQNICCTHYDAFRFYTPEARPLNTFNPSFATRLEMEQGGCLHANMDLYKWAYKLWPWIGSDLVADAFEVALFGRAMDMRASPYDLEALGFPPIRIETEEGRAEYRRCQQELAAKAELVRRRLERAAAALA